MKRTPMHKTVEDIAQAAGCLDKFQAAVAKGQEFYLKAEVAGYMPLVIEVLGCTKEVSVAHYARQNGDAMRDPEYVFETRNWRPIETTNDYLGWYQRAPKGYYLGAGAIDFCRMWAMNIREQGFSDPKSAKYTVDA
jgi:hypothetical protein